MYHLVVQLVLCPVVHCRCFFATQALEVPATHALCKHTSSADANALTALAHRATVQRPLVQLHTTSSSGVLERVTRLRLLKLMMYHVSF